jgi:hypothetical protein
MEKSRSPKKKIQGRRTEWLLKKSIMNAIVQSNGTIFGGAVRDLVLHDKHATKFYEQVGTQSLDEINVLYRDPKYLPHLDGRFATPNDIDVFIHELHLLPMLERLRKLRFEVKRVFERDPKNYFPELTIEPGTIRHDRYILYSFRPKSFISAIRNVVPWSVYDLIRDDVEKLTAKVSGSCCHSIQLDVMVSLISMHEPQPEPPFGNIDFQCNALLYNKRGIAISDQLWPTMTLDPVAKAARLNEIMDDISKREAVMSLVWKPKDYRVAKMIRKGWLICSHEVQEIHDDDNKYDGYCIICQDEFHNKTQYKLGCCDARYHVKCMKDAFNIGPAAMGSTSECVMCKKIIQWPAHANAFINAKCSIENAEL